MWNRSELPVSGALRVYVTAERITEESASEGDAAERGWVNAVGTSAIYENRNDVKPVFECNVLDLNADEYETLDDVLSKLGQYETDDGSTLYGVDGHVPDYATDDTFNYAMHAHVKYFKPFVGWVEEEVDVTK